ncbi:SurA N-terminal domain-containing protein [Castellaniella sp.]|uniref:SurA N-terminal domain-containing protein n=1 Tax=Castellaniella sp. TaxID=1955812 RepID=UPI00355F76BD
MFDFIRTHQRLMQLILLVLVVPSFVFLGVSGYSFVTADAALAVVEHAEVKREAFTEAQRNQLQQMQESTQGRFDPAMLDNPQARQALLDQLVDRQVQIAVASKNHFSVSDATLRKAIAAMPQLQVNGQFSPDRYNEILASYGLSPRDFEAGQRAELSLDTVLGPVRDTAHLPVPVLDRIKRALTEQRTIRLRFFQAAEHREQVQVSEADVQAWYDGHQDTLRLPEQVSADYLVLDEAAAKAAVPAVDESQLKEYYEQNKARYVVPARADVSHILVKPSPGDAGQADQAALDKAEDLARRARATPAEFAELARAESQDAGSARDGGHLGWMQRGSLPPALEEAVFALAPGQVSDPVKGPDGYHIFKLDGLEPEHGESFDQVRGKIEDEVRQQLAAERFADMATRLTGLVYDQPASLEPAAKELGLSVRHASAIGRDRLLTGAESHVSDAAADGQDAAILGDVRVRQALFSPSVYADRQNSGVIEISPDTMAVVRVADVVPAHVPTLDLVQAQIRARLVDERALEAAREQGEQVLAGLEKGAEASDFQAPVTLSRLDPGGVSKTILDEAFSLPDHDLPGYGGATLSQAYVIVQLDQVQPGTQDQAALAGLDAQLAQVWGGLEEQAVLTRLREQLGVQITDEGRKVVAEGVGGQQ